MALGMTDFRYNVNSTYDPWSQTFNITEPDGVTPYLASIVDVNTVLSSVVLRSICQASQTGAAMILLVTLMLVTKTDKRRSIVFLLNSLALLFVVLRGILTLLVYTGPFYDFYRWELMWYDDIGDAKAVSAGGEVMAFILWLTIEMSLVFQVRIVCRNLSSLRRTAINSFNALLAFITLAVRFALMVLNIDWNIVHVQIQTAARFKQLSTLAAAADITLVISIGISALIFCAKLWFAIEARRSMGMNQFGPMQIIFVMGCQTMCTPLIFMIISYFGVKDAQISSFVPTIVAISLPLSAMWAAVNTNNVQIAKPNTRVRRAIPVGADDLASGRAYGGSKEHFRSTMNTSDTLVDDDSAALTTPGRKTRFSEEGMDLEMQRVGGKGVQVDRTYSVRSD